MKIEEIMKDKERLYNQTLFRRKGKSFCIRWIEGYGFEKITSCKKYDSEDDEVYRYNFIPEDFLVDDWEWVNEWYEVNFKKKYPNGVLCRAWNENTSVYIVVIKDYDKLDERFVDTTGRAWKYAEPIKSEEAPAIIGEEV